VHQKDVGLPSEIIHQPPASGTKIWADGVASSRRASSLHECLPGIKKPPRPPLRREGPGGIWQLLYRCLSTFQEEVDRACVGFSTTPRGISVGTRLALPSWHEIQQRAAGRPAQEQVHGATAGNLPHQAPAPPGEDPEADDGPPAMGAEAAPEAV